MQAGKLLNEVSKNKPEIKEILDHNDFKTSWYRALKKFSNAYNFGQIVKELDKDGNHMGTIFTGSIYNIPENSANLCLFLDLNYPIKKSFHTRLWKDYGKQVIIGTTITVIGGVILALILSLQ